MNSTKVTLYSITKNHLKDSEWKDVEASFFSLDDQLAAVILKTHREIRQLGFNFVPGTVIECGDELYKIIGFDYLPLNKKYPLCKIVKIDDRDTALNELYSTVAAELREEKQQKAQLKKATAKKTA